MADHIVFESAEPWDGERPQTLVISCVDGRWRPYIQEFLTGFLAIPPHTDFMAVPGGVEPLTLVDLIPKDFNFFRRRIESLVAAHGTRRIVCIAHQDCSWYAARKIGPVRLDLQARQLGDLRRAAAWMRETFPNVRVETYFARRLPVPGGPEKVVFEAV
jgi:Putative carbonic anhydrase